MIHWKMDIWFCFVFRSVKNIDSYVKEVFLINIKVGTRIQFSREQIRFFLSRISYTLTRNVCLISTNTRQTLWKSKIWIYLRSPNLIKLKKTRWKRDGTINTLCKTVGVTNNGQKRSMLLTYTGVEMYEIY